MIIVTSVAACVVGEASCSDWITGIADDPTLPDQVVSYVYGVDRQSKFVFNLYSDGTLNAGIVENYYCPSDDVKIYFKFGFGDWDEPVSGYIQRDFRHRLTIWRPSDVQYLLSKSSIHDLVEVAFRDGCNDLEGGIFSISGEPFK